MTSEPPISYLPGSPGDRALVARLLAGEEPAYRECYRAHAPRAYALLVRILRDRHAAEEILQETFIAAFDKIGQYRGQARLSTWINEIAIRRALNALRERGRRLPSDGRGCEEATDAGGETRLVRRDLARRMLDLMDRLSEDQRVALLLAAEGYTAAEIAGLTDAPRPTVLARLARGRARLLTLAADSGLVAADAAAEEPGRG
jgi:RNA polymerase sigma-70 factor (ECF subfamily)